MAELEANISNRINEVEKSLINKIQPVKEEPEEEQPEENEEKENEENGEATIEDN